jgi:hypothetical protein
VNKIRTLVVTMSRWPESGFWAAGAGDDVEVIGQCADGVQA